MNELRTLDQVRVYVKRILNRDNKPYSDGTLDAMMHYFQYHDRLQTYPTDERLQAVYLMKRYVTLTPR